MGCFGVWVYLFVMGYWVLVLDFCFWVWLFGGSSLASMEMRTAWVWLFGGDKIRRPWSLAVDLLWRQWSWGRRGFAFWVSALRKHWRERDKNGKKWDKEGIKMGLQICYLIRVSFFLSNKTYIPNTYFIFFEHWKTLFKLWYQTHFFVLLTLKTRCSTTLFKPQFSHLFKQ